METTNSSMPPTYREIFEEIGKQLSNRKSILLKRILLITWPFILLIIAGYIIGNNFNLDSLTSEQKFTYFIVFVCYLFVSIIYSTIIRFIFKIEKQIWIDSFFDKRNLESAESWRIARKLFWPSIVFRIKIWLKYYLVPILVLILSFLLSLKLIIPENISKDSAGYITISILILSIVSLICIVAYGYYLKTKLRYSWFIFLDKYGDNNSYKLIIEEMNKLNDISKSETFRKSLLANIGADSVNSLIRMVVGSISYGVSQFGGLGKAVGSIMRVYGEEASRQATEFGNIAAQYVLYRFARKEAFGKEQEINENIYNLK